MQLTTIHGDGIKKASDLTITVPKLLALTGPIGAGKSTIHQLIKLGVIGHDPDMGKTLAATRQLASGRGDIEVRLGWEGGFGVRRSMGKSKKTEVFPPKGETTEDEAQARIDEETGSFLPAFDLGSFLKLSSEKRRERLFELLPRELLTNWSQDLFREWLGYTDAEVNFKTAIDRLWIEQVENAQSPVEGLASALEFIHKRFLEADAERQSQEKVAIAAAGDAEAAAKGKAAVEGEGLEALQLAISSIEQRLGELRERKAGVERARRREVERQQRLTLVGTRIESGRAVIKALSTEREGLASPPAEELRRIADALVDLEALRRKQVEALTVFRTEASAAHRTHASLVEHRDLLRELETCPTCGSVADLSRAKEQAEIAAAEQESRLAEFDARVGKETALLARTEEDLAKLRVASDQLRAIADRSRKLTHDIGQAEALLRGITEEKARLETEVQEIPDVDVAQIDAEVSALEDQAFGIREQIGAIQQAAEAVGRAKGAIERADRERKELDRLTARARGLKELRGGLQKLRGHVIKQMVAPVETVANELLQEIDPAKRFEFVFEREGKDTFDFGFSQDGAFRGYDAASKGEDALLGIVFVAALIAAVQPKWRLLRVDDIEAVDSISGARRNLMEALVRVADRFDNILISGCCEFAEVEGWTILDVRTLQPVQLAGAA